MHSSKTHNRAVSKQRLWFIRGLRTITVFWGGSFYFDKFAFLSRFLFRNYFSALKITTGRVSELPSKLFCFVVLDFLSSFFNGKLPYEFLSYWLSSFFRFLTIKLEIFLRFQGQCRLKLVQTGRLPTKQRIFLTFI
jgi:hypothetical protein